MRKLERTDMERRRADQPITPPLTKPSGCFPWLEIQCSWCKTPNDVDLAALKHPANDLRTQARKPSALPQVHQDRAASFGDFCSSLPASRATFKLKSNNVQSSIRSPPTRPRSPPCSVSSTATSAICRRCRARFPTIRHRSCAMEPTDESSPWRDGHPSSQFALMQATKKRAAKLEAKGKPVDFRELLRMEPKGGTTNIRKQANAQPERWHIHYAGVPSVGDPARRRHLISGNGIAGFIPAAIPVNNDTAPPRHSMMPELRSKRHGEITCRCVPRQTSRSGATLKRARARAQGPLGSRLGN